MNLLALAAVKWLRPLCFFALFALSMAQSWTIHLLHARAAAGIPIFEVQGTGCASHPQQLDFTPSASEAAQAVKRDLDQECDDVVMARLRVHPDLVYASKVFTIHHHDLDPDDEPAEIEDWRL